MFFIKNIANFIFIHKNKISIFYLISVTCSNYTVSIPRFMIIFNYVVRRFILTYVIKIFVKLYNFSLEFIPFSNLSI